MATTPPPPPASILGTLGDFTSRENWDKFFALRGTGDNFEWYAEWPNLRDPLLALLGDCGAAAEEAAAAPEILVPACGSSALSERLYDAGFRSITNVDFSRVVVTDMLRRHARARPEMRWRVMDITNMQFADGSFDVILDKGGLDALMEPGAGTKLGTKYLNEAKRVLKSGGKFVCLTLAESHVLALLLSEFRFGWDTSIQAIASESSKKSAFQTFMVIIVKGKMAVVQTIKSSLDQSAEYHNMKQANAVIRALGNENIIRESYSSGVDVLLSLSQDVGGSSFLVNRKLHSIATRLFYWMPRSKPKHLYTTVEFLLCLRLELMNGYLLQKKDSGMLLKVLRLPV